MFEQLKGHAHDASRTVRKMLALTCSTKSAVAHGSGMTTVERVLTPDLGGIAKMPVFDDLCPTSLKVRSHTVTTP